MRKVSEIKGVHSGLSINKEQISYYANNFDFKILNTNTQLLYTELKFDRDYSYKLIDGQLYFTTDDELKVFNVEKRTFLIKRSSIVKYIKALTSLRFIGITYHRRERIYDNFILDQNCNLLWHLSGDLSFRDIHERHILLSDRHGNKIGYLDFEVCKVNWQQELSQSITGESIETNDLIVIPLSNSLAALKSDSGEKMWENQFALSHYNYDEACSKLYGIGGRTFEVINIDNGEREMQKDLDEDLHISSHLTCYDNGLVYFSGFKNNNIPVFGAVNVQTGVLEFVQEVKISEEKSFRIGLDKPIVVGNRLYVKDSMNTLHIFEKE